MEDYVLRKRKMDKIFIQQRHKELQVKYKKEEELYWKCLKEGKNDEAKIHYGNKKFYEGQMRTLLDICEGKFGRV